MQPSGTMMRFFTCEERPDLVERYSSEAEEFWPPHKEFVYHDPVCEHFWPRLGTELPAFQFVVFDEAEDRFLAQGNTIPLCWSGQGAREERAPLSRARVSMGAPPPRARGRSGTR